MYVLALATDYDGTIAHHGVVNEATIEALTHFKGTGRRLVLVTGRDLPDLRRVFPEIALFDRVVAENGALLYDPKADVERVLAPAPPGIFIERLKQCDVSPLSVGRSIVATWHPNETKVLDVIQELGHAVSIGDAKTPPRTEEAIKLLNQLEANVVINTQHLVVSERPEFFAKLFTQIATMRASTGRPHWLLIDEAHHLLPVSRGDVAESLPDEIPAAIFVTVHPEAILPTALKKSPS